MPTRSSTQLAPGRVVRRLCPPVFAKPRPPRSAATSAGSVPSSCPSRSPTSCAQMAAGPGVGADRGSGRLFDHRRPGHAQGADRRPAQRRAQPEAGFGHLPGRHDRRRRPSRSSPASPQAAQNVGGCGGAEKLAAEFNGEVVQSDGVKLQRTAAGAPGNDAADAGRPGDPPVRLARGGRAGARHVRPRRDRPDACRPTTRCWRR